MNSVLTRPASQHRSIASGFILFSETLIDQLQISAMSQGKLRVALKNKKILDAHTQGKKQTPAVPKLVKPVLQEIEPELDDEEDAEQLEIEELQNKETLSKKEKRRLKKLLEKAEQRKQNQDESENDEDEDEDEETEETALDYKTLAESEDESEEEEQVEEALEENEEEDEEEEEEEEDEEEEKEEEEVKDEEDVPLSDAELDSDGDVVPHSKLTINNVGALKQSLARIQLPWAKHAFTEHQSILSPERAEEGIKDIYDDTERELAFYKQGLDAAKQGKATLLKLKVPFTRPLDYFAEMVKSDEHMDKLKSKLLKEAADIKASEDAKKQRQLKKFGKKVMHETLQDRARQKKDTLERIKSLKKKRGANEISNDDEFQIALEEATAEDRPKRMKPNGKRQAKDAKYGFGGKKRFLRKNDADSSADIYGRGKGKGKGKPSRPGKSRRKH